MVAIYTRSDMERRASPCTYLEYHLGPLIFLRFVLYGARQGVNLLQKQAMGILDGENWGGFRRVRPRKAETGSALTTALSTQVPVAHVTMRER